VVGIVNRPVVRLLMIGVPALAVQTTVLTRWTLGGTVIELMLLLAVAGGVAGGPERGALAGFVLGMLFDLAYPADPFGLAALVYGAVAWLVGYANASTIRHPWWFSSALVGVGGAVGTIVYPVACLFVGVEGRLTSDVVGLAVEVGLLSAFLAPLAVPVMRWGLRAGSDRPDLRRAGVIAP
jgi:rod shape-determining protein MreD